MDQIESKQKRLLIIVLLINLVLFILEFITGLISHSMGLIADSMDMLADVFVYGLSLMAIGKALTLKHKVATLSGYFQLLLAILGLIEVVRRFFGVGDIPTFQIMIIVSTIALIGNAVSLYLLKKSKNQEVHMQASMIFTSNDVIVNIGVIIAAVLVYITSSKIPDLVIGTLVFLIVAKGAFRILKLSKIRSS